MQPTHAETEAPVHAPRANRIQVQANGLDFECLTWGESGPLVLLLHGFPDAPHAWTPIGEGLAAQGFRAVAPYIRGYGPTRPPADGDYTLMALGEDVAALILALGAERAVVVGHDWGAVMGWMGAALAPHRIAVVIGMSVPPLGALLRAATPAQLKRSRYMGFFQLPGIAEASVRSGGLERLWRRWSPGFDASPAHLAEVRSTLSAPGSLSAALGYYRSLLQDGVRRPKRWWAGWRRALRPVPGRVVVVHGTRDRCIAPAAFADLDRHCVQTPIVHALDAGHFLPSEAPDEVLAIILRAAHDAFVTQR